jgi:flagellar assembly protein FliH
MFVRGEAASAFSPFTALLPTLDAAIEKGLNKTRLGRTAEGLHKLKEEAKSEGRAEGIEAGKIDGFQDARNEMQQTIAEFRDALDHAAQNVERAIADWYVASEQSLSELSVSIATRILGRELSVSDDAITELVREAVREVAAADKIRIRVNPFDASILLANKELVLTAHPTVRSVEIVEDPLILGGAKIESDSGAIDASIKTQLELAFESLRRPGK